MIGYIIISGILGLIVGIIFTRLSAKKPKVFGYMHVIDSDEPGENPYCFVDYDISPKELSKEKYVTFIITCK